jgi:hypothetical protein
MISALVSAGLEGGYLANPRLARVHWQLCWLCIADAI